MSGGAKAVSSGRTRLFRGVDALWNEFEKGMDHEEDDQRRASADTFQSKAYINEKSQD